MTLTIADAATLGIILEGAYVVLFILYLVLRRRDHGLVDGPLALAQVLLFCLCTTSMCLDIPGIYFDVLPDIENIDAVNKLTMSSMVVFTLIDYLAQMILLYRCWIIWDRRWVIVFIPGFLAFATFGGGLTLAALGFIVNSPIRRAALEKFLELYTAIGTTAYAISLGVNALTTSLLVIKIYLTSREVRSVLGSDSHPSLRIVTAMLIESGLLTFAFQLVFVVLFYTQLPAADILPGVLTHIYGITPTILNIRVVMGSASDKTTEKSRSLRFAHSRGAATETTRPSMSAAGTQSRVVDIDLDEVPNGATDTAV